MPLLLCQHFTLQDQTNANQQILNCTKISVLCASDQRKSRGVKVYFKRLQQFNRNQEALQQIYTLSFLKFSSLQQRTQSSLLVQAFQMKGNTAIHSFIFSLVSIFRPKLSQALYENTWRLYILKNIAMFGL